MTCADFPFFKKEVYREAIYIDRGWTLGMGPFHSEFKERNYFPLDTLRVGISPAIRRNDLHDNP